MSDDVFWLVLIYLPLALLILAGPIMSVITFVLDYHWKWVQKRQAKCATVLFSKINPTLIDFYKRYSGLPARMINVPAIVILIMYASWLSFWIQERDNAALKGEILRISLIHLAFWIFSILYWTLYLRDIIRLIKVKREIKSQTLSLDKQLNEHKIFCLLPFGTHPVKIQERVFKSKWMQLQRRIENNEKITGKGLLSFFRLNIWVIEIISPYLVSNAKQLGINIDPTEAYRINGTWGVNFKDVQGKQFTPQEVLEIVRDYFVSMSFMTDLSNKEAIK